MVSCSADSFIISKRLTITTIDVRNSETSKIFTVLNNGNIGLGTGAPTVKLDIVGDIKGTDVAASILSAESLNANNGKFIVKTNGNVGLGTSEPQSQVQIVQSVYSHPSRPFYGPSRQYQFTNKYKPKRVWI